MPKRTQSAPSFPLSGLSTSLLHVRSVSLFSCGAQHLPDTRYQIRNPLTKRIVPVYGRLVHRFDPFTHACDGVVRIRDLLRQLVDLRL
jgi:hypothetical protein